MEFERYIALGDSISTDDYPGEDRGAVSLFYRNTNDIYPDFKGKDLISLYPGIELEALAYDGSTSEDVLNNQLSSIQDTGQTTLVTLTVGGNDLLGALSYLEAGSDNNLYFYSLRKFEEDLDAILSELSRLKKRPKIILGTIYDPTDGTGELPDFRSMDPGLLTPWNDIIYRRCDERTVHLADIHDHFWGHGYTNKNDCWYTNYIEPNKKGGHEVRRVFHDVLKDL